MKIHHLTVEQGLSSLRSSRKGLTRAEAARRLREFGPNQVAQIAGESLLRKLLRQFTHLFAIILWIGAVMAFVADRHDSSQGMATLGFAIIAVIVVNGVFSFAQEYSATKAIAELRKLLPREVQVVRDGGVSLAPAADLVPGDVVLLEAGDQIPADCRVVEAVDALVNTSTITGESVPEARDELPSAEEAATHSRNTLLAGTFLVGGRARALVFATGMQTEFGKIAHLAQSGADGLSPLQIEIARVARIVAVVALALGAAFFAVGGALGLPPWDNLIFVIGIIVANVPEGLLPTVTLALAMGSKRMARRNALIRNLPAVEALGCATVICTDKTGTLTQNKMAVAQVFAAGRTYPARPVELQQAAEAQPHLFAGAALCHSLHKAQRQDGRRPALIGDPMEVALVAMAAQAGCKPDAPRVDEVPFDSERRRASTVHRTARGLVVHTKGALESLLPLCTSAELGDGPTPLTPQIREQLTRAGEGMAMQGQRVLAFAHRAVEPGYERAHLEEGLTLSGLVGLRDPPRPEVPEAIRKCRQAGIRIFMVTGDHPRTAEAVAREIGLVSGEPIVLTGEQLHRKSEAELQLLLDEPEVLFARIDAADKRRVVAALRRKKEIVAVTGDGVNDAPALKEADIGIAMGRSGTDVAREVADVVLTDDNFASIVDAIEEGRAVFANVRKFLTYILTSNVPELVPYLMFVLLRVPLALTIVQILAIDLGTDLLPALALGAEPPNPTVMQVPPRRAGERLIDGRLLLRAYLFLGVLEAVAAMAAFFFVLGQGGWRWGQPLAADAALYREATTACLGAIVVAQVANVLVCRSEVEVGPSRGALQNRLLLSGVAVELLLLLLIVYTPVGQALFGTAALPAQAWLFMLPFAGLILLLGEGRKAWLRRARAAPALAEALPGSRRRRAA